MRFCGGNWDNSASLLSRVIVAGGGGSDGYVYNGDEEPSYGYGGNGGGVSGDNANDGCAYSEYDEYCGIGGQQTCSGYSIDYTIATQTTTEPEEEITKEDFCGGFGFGGNRTAPRRRLWRRWRWTVGMGAQELFQIQMKMNQDIQEMTTGEEDGGSGFVWTESSKDDVPEGYSVDSQYYLSDAGTYVKDETGFVSNPANTENGYARITLISGTSLVETSETTTKTATRWKGILNGISFDYNGKTITETDSGNNIIKHHE